MRNFPFQGGSKARWDSSQSRLLISNDLLQHHFFVTALPSFFFLIKWWFDPPVLSQLDTRLLSVKDLQTELKARCALTNPTHNFPSLRCPTVYSFPLGMLFVRTTSFRLVFILPQGQGPHFLGWQVQPASSLFFPDHPCRIQILVQRQDIFLVQKHQPRLHNLH